MPSASADQHLCFEYLSQHCRRVQNFLGGGLPFSPVISIPGFFQAGGSSSNDETVHNFQAQIGDQLSWNIGKHTVRVGGEFEQVNWFWDYQGLSHGITAFQTFDDFLIGLPGGCGAAVVGVCNGSSFSNVLNTNNFSVRSGPGGIVHGYKASNGNCFAQDDIKVNQRLDREPRVRWEYDGLMADKYGNATNLWLRQIRLSVFQATSPQTPRPRRRLGGGEQLQYEDLGRASGRSTATQQPGPQQERCSAADLLPALGLPGSRSPAISWSSAAALVTSTIAFPETPSAMPLSRARRTRSRSIRAPAPTSSLRWQHPFQTIPLGTFPTRWLNFATNQGSDLAQSFMVDNLITPLVYSWNFNVQYQLAPTWMIEPAMSVRAEFISRTRCTS